MRSNQIFGVTIVAFSLGIGGALAATPTFNMQDKSIKSPAGEYQFFRVRSFSHCK